MTLDTIKQQTTWNDAAASINSNFAKLLQAINAGVGNEGFNEEELRNFLESSGYTTEEWVLARGYITASSLVPYAKKEDLSSYATKGELTSAIDGLNISQYATKAALSTLQGQHDNLRSEFDALNNLLSSDTTDYINTWNEVVAFLDGYKDESDLATILSGMNANISSRLLASDFESWKTNTFTPLVNLVDGHTTRLDGLDQSILSINTRIDGVDKTIEDHIAEFIAFRANFEITDNLILVRKNFASTEEVSAKGINQGTGGGGGSSYSRLDTWEGYDNNKAGYVLSAGLGYGLKVAIDELNGYDLDNRVRSIENSYVSKDAGGVVNGGLVVSSLAIAGGSSSQFLKADGSLDGTSYLPTSGGSISGDLNISGILDWARYISTRGHYFFVRDDDGANWCVTNRNWTAEYTLLHSGNVGDYALPLTGGTITSTSHNVLRINSSYTEEGIAFSRLYIAHFDADKAFVGWDTQNGTILYNSSGKYLGIKDDGTPYYYSGQGAYNTLLHSGNIGDYAMRYYGTNMPSNIVNYVGYGKPAEGWYYFGPAISFGYGAYYAQMQMASDGSIWSRISWEGSNSDWKTIAFTDSDITGNAGSATKLNDNTAYTIWGNTFFENGKPNNVTNPAIMRYLLFSDSDGGESGFIGRGGDDDSLFFRSYKNAPIYIGRAQYIDLLIKDGNVGIGTASPSYKLDVIGDIRATESITIGGATLSWENGALKVNTSFYSEKEISAKGLSTGGGSGASYNRLDAWGDYDSSKAGYVLSAGLGYDLNTRLSSLSGVVDTHTSRLSSLENAGYITSSALSGYLPTNGGTISNGIWAYQLNLNALNTDAGLRFSINGTLKGLLRVDSNQDLWYQGASENLLLHSGNVGEYALKMHPYDWSSESKDANAVAQNQVINHDKWTNAPNNTIASLLDLSYSRDWRWQLFASPGDQSLYSRFRHSGTTWESWKTLAFTDSNVASAQALMNQYGGIGATVDSSSHVHFYSNRIYWHGDSSNYYIAFPFDGVRSPHAEIAGYGGIQFLVSGVPAMLINPSRNVTIGNGDLATAIPSCKFYVDGKIVGKDEINLFQPYSTVRLTHYVTDGVGRIYTYDDMEGYCDTYIGHNDGDAIVVKANGNVLIGTTTDNGAKLQVNGDASIAGDVKLRCGFDSVIGSTYDISNSNLYNYIKFGANESGLKYYSGLWTSGDFMAHEFIVTKGSAMTIMNHGNVLIGTTDNRSQKLQVVGGAYIGNETNGIWIGKSGETIDATTPSGGSLPLYLNHSSSGDIIMSYGGGNVGIGTTPSERLDVDGNTRVRGDIITNRIIIGGVTLSTEDGVLKIESDMYATGEISAHGLNKGESGGGGSSYSRLDTWIGYDSSKAGYVLSAGLGYDLNIRLSSLSGVVDTHTSRLSSLENAGYITSSALSGYLPTNGGTINGVLNIYNTSDRATINLVSLSDVPNDLYFGSNGIKHWSLTSRDTAMGNDFLLYKDINPTGFIFRVSGSTGVVDFTHLPTYNGNSFYHTGNFNPSDYLPTSGGTISNGIWAYQLNLNALNTDAGLRFSINGAVKGLLRVDSNQDLWYQGASENLLLHSGNIGEYAPAITAIQGETYAAFIGEVGTAYIAYRGGSYWSVTDNGWSNEYPLIHSGNIGSQSVAYATNAGTVGGYGIPTNDNKPWGALAYITPLGWMEIGKHIEFHYDNTTGSDYSTALGCTGNYGNFVYLPSASGTLALTTDNVASATKLATPRTIWGQSFDGTGDVSGNITLDKAIGINLDDTWTDNSGNTHPWYGLDFTHIEDWTTLSSYYGLALKTGSVSIYLKSSGNVGIGIDSPQYKLHVDGTGYFSGALTANGGLTVSGILTVGGASIHPTANNPYFQLYQNNNYWYWQADDNYTYIGGTMSKALRIDQDGNTLIRGSLGVDALLTASNGLTVSGLSTLTGGIATNDIHGNGQTLYLGNAGNNAYIKVREDMSGVDGAWSIPRNGNAVFNTLTVNGASLFRASVAMEAAVVLDSTLTVSDATTLSSLSVSGNTELQGDLRLRPSGKDFGSSLKFGDGSFCCIQEDTNDHMKVTARHGVTFESSEGTITIPKLSVGINGMAVNGPATFNDFIYSSSITPKTDNYYVLGNNNYKWYAVTAYNVNVHDAITIEAGKELRFKDDNGVVHTLKYDSTKQAFVFDGNVNATGEVSAKRLNA